MKPLTTLWRIAASLALLIAGPVQAQTEAPADDPPAEPHEGPGNTTDGAEGAAPAPAEPTTGDGASPLDASEDQVQRAQDHFLKGKELFDDGKFEEALAEFSMSRAAVASPNTLLYVARCQVSLDRLQEAYATFTHVIAEGTKLGESESRYQRAAESAEHERAQLASSLGLLRLKVRNAAEGTEVWLNGQLLPREEWTELVPVLPGTLEIEIRTPDRSPQTHAGRIQPDETLELSFDVSKAESTAPPPPAPKPQPRVQATQQLEAPQDMSTYAWIAGGVGVAGLATFGVFGAMASKTHGDLEDKCGSGPCPTDESDLISKGKQRQTIANIGLIVGAVGVAASATLFVLDSSGNSEEPVAELLVGPSWVGVRGHL